MSGTAVDCRTCRVHLAMHTCSRCGVAHYCTAACAVHDWRHGKHRLFCRTIAALRAHHRHCKTAGSPHQMCVGQRSGKRKRWWPVEEDEDEEGRLAKRARRDPNDDPMEIEDMEEFAEGLDTLPGDILLNELFPLLSDEQLLRLREQSRRLRDLVPRFYGSNAGRDRTPPNLFMIEAPLEVLKPFFQHLQMLRIVSAPRLPLVVRSLRGGLPELITRLPKLAVLDVKYTIKLERSAPSYAFISEHIPALE